MNSARLISLTDVELTRFFFAIVLLLASSHFFGYLFQRCKIPKAIGEIFGGLLLGPTVLGFFSPGGYAWIFNAFESEGKLLSAIYWLGLVMLMFISGFEMQKTFQKDDGKILFAVLIGGTVIPFLTGWKIMDMFDTSLLLGEKNNLPALKVVVGIAFAVTSIPVISKIFIDLNIMQTRFAKLVVSAATLEDVILWAALAVVTGMVGKDAVSLSEIFTTVLLAILFFLVSLLFIPKLLSRTNRLRFNFLIKSSVSGYVLFICFFFAALASILNINIVFGAFLAGIIVGAQDDPRFEDVKSSIKDISLAFFVPVYFSIVGLKLDLIHQFAPAFFAGFLLMAMAVKTGGTVLAAKCAGRDWLSSFNFGIAMNTRGGPGIVLATVAYDMGIISELFFTTLVMVAIVTSLLAGAWFKFALSRQWELLK